MKFETSNNITLPFRPELKRENDFNKSQIRFEVTSQRTKVEIKPGKRKKKKERTSENGVKNDFHEKLNRSHPQGELARFHLDRMDNPYSARVLRAIKRSL